MAHRVRRIALLSLAGLWSGAAVAGGPVQVTLTHVKSSEGIVHVGQPDAAIAAARAALPNDPWSIAAVHVVTTLTGSALLALALKHGRLDAEQVWAAAHVDEDWNSEKWGIDEEVAARRAARLVDFKAAASVLRSLNPGLG